MTFFFFLFTKLKFIVGAFQKKYHCLEDFSKGMINEYSSSLTPTVVIFICL